MLKETNSCLLFKRAVMSSSPNALGMLMPVNQSKHIEFEICTMSAYWEIDPKGSA